MRPKIRVKPDAVRKRSIPMVNPATVKTRYVVVSIQIRGRNQTPTPTIHPIKVRAGIRSFVPYPTVAATEVISLLRQSCDSQVLLLCPMVAHQIVHTSSVDDPPVIKDKVSRTHNARQVEVLLNQDESGG